MKELNKMGKGRDEERGEEEKDRYNEEAHMFSQGGAGVAAERPEKKKSTRGRRDR